MLSTKQCCSVPAQGQVVGLFPMAAALVLAIDSIPLILAAQQVTGELAGVRIKAPGHQSRAMDHPGLLRQGPKEFCVLVHRT